MDTRRQFIKTIAAGMAAAGTAGCRQTLNKAIPYLIRPEEIIPGESLHYATTYYDGYTYGEVVARIVDGRPVKIDGNKQSVWMNGASNARIQASLFDLYHHRVLSPAIKGKPCNWDDFFMQTNPLLTDPGKRIAFFCHSMVSPSELALMSRFLNTFPALEKIEYDLISCKPEAQCHNELFGTYAIPLVRLQGLKLLLTFSSDKLADYVLPEYFTARYTNAAGNLQHYHYDCCPTLTGRKARRFFLIHPSEEKIILANIYNFFADRNKYPLIPCPPYHSEESWKWLERYSNSMLVLTGSDDPENIRLAALINYFAGSYDHFLSLSEAVRLRTAPPARLIIEQPDQYRDYDGFIFYDCNPAGDALINKQEWIDLIESKPSVCLASRYHATALNAAFLAPVCHTYEMWGDAMPVNGYYSFQQPLIQPAGQSLHRADILLRWTGESMDYKKWLFSRWENIYREDESCETTFDDFMEKTIQSGLYRSRKFEPPFTPVLKHPGKPPSCNFLPAVSVVNVRACPVHGDGRMAANPLLDELPHPVAHVTGRDFILLHAETSNAQVTDGPYRVVYDTWQHREVITCYYGSPAHEAMFRLSGSGNKQKHAVVHLAVLSGSMFSHRVPRRSVHPPHSHPEKQWVMCIDLDRCTGCGSCVIACQMENNIPPVGPEEADKGRLMHWIRIGQMVLPNGRSFSVPLLCQQCHQAPCESVCPVAATMHSSDGINQMIYNRCIGARYCNNNCPYHARVFNFYDYAAADPLSSNNPPLTVKLQRTLTLMRNPDVTVRSKGVMEKCNFCYQRIQKFISGSKSGIHPLPDVRPACAVACPAGAISFGNRITNPDLADRFASPSARFLLNELNTIPSVAYFYSLNKEDDQLS